MDQQELPEPHAITVAPQQTRMSTGGFVPGRMDPDVASLSLSIDQHMQALTKDAVEHLLAVKARMLFSLEAAVAEEVEDGKKKLATKQAETDVVAADLKHTQQLLAHTDTLLERVAGGYSRKQQAVYDRLNLLRSFYVWREWAQKERRLQHMGLRLQQWYVRRWLMGRAWDRWHGQARLQYRTLVAERAEKQQKADAAALHAIHATEAAGLRAQIQGLQQQLQDEAEARNNGGGDEAILHERCVTAINLEALQIMRRGAPPAGANPFPVVAPLTASTAAAGLTAAAAAVAGGGQQQGPHEVQELVVGADLGVEGVQQAAFTAVGNHPEAQQAAGGCSQGLVSSPHWLQQSLLLPPSPHQQNQQQQQPSPQGAGGGSAAASVSSQSGRSGGVMQSHSVYGGGAPPAAATQMMHLQQQKNSRSPQHSNPPGGSSTTRVFIERGPGAGRVPTPAVASPVAKASPGRSAGVRRSLNNQAAGKSFHQGHQGR